MSKLNFKDAIFADFNSYWVANAPSPVPSIFYVDDPRSPPIPGDAVSHNNILEYSWIRNVIIYSFIGDQSLGAVGNRRVSHEATLVSSIFTPFGFGEELNDQLSDICYSGMLAMNIPYVDHAFPAHNTVGRDGNWLQSNVALELQITEVR